MSNSFDFELIADDRVSATIDEINEAIKNLLPQLDETQEKLNLGGDETVDSLDDVGGRLDKMARSARDNVQFIGDIIPPLKIVGELADKVATFGAAGVVGYGIKKVADGFRDAAKEAYNLETHAQNTAMSAKEFSALSGALRILGTDSETAAASIESIFNAFNEAASGKNAGVMAAMAQIGAQIEKNSDGSVNLLKTLESIANIFPTLRPDQQKSFADAVGLTPDLLTLMREGAKYATLLAKADKFGLTVDPEFNAEMSEANRQMNELYARFEGLKKIATNGAIKLFRHDPAIDKSLNDAQKYDGKVFYHGDRDKDIRWKALRDDEFKSSLSASERLNFTLNRPDPEVEKKLNARYGAMWQAYSLQNDLSAALLQKVPGNNLVPYRQNTGGGQYDDILNAAGKKHGVDPRLLKAVMMQESGGNPNIISDADARGLMQLIPSNLKALGITNWRDPNQNIDGGASILAENLQKAGGDISLALRYYHGGYDRSRWGRVNAAYPGAVLARYQKIIESDNQGSVNQSPAPGIIQPSSGAGAVSVNDITKSFKSAMEDNKLKLEITTINERGERKVFETQSGGRITLPMNY